MDFDAAYREGYVAGVTAHVEHSRCQRCYDAGQARVAALTADVEGWRVLAQTTRQERDTANTRLAALTAALEQIREQRCCDHCPAIAEAALDAAGGA